MRPKQMDALKSCHLPLHLQEPAPVTLRAGEGFLQARARTLALFERDAIGRLLAEARGNVSVAARRAGITRRNLHRLILKYRIKTKSFRSGTYESQ